MAEGQTNLGTGAQPTDPFAALVSDFVQEELSPEEKKPAAETPPPEDTPAQPEAEVEDAADAAAETDPEGESDEPAEDPENEQPEPRKFRVKVDGEEIEVTEDELVNGYSRTTDYTRKTMKLAEERKAFEAAFEAEHSAVRAEREKYASLLTQLEQTLTTNVPAEPDWVALRREVAEGRMDESEYLSQYQGWQTYKSQVQAVQAERETVQRQLQAQQIQAYQQHLESQKALVVELIPEWKKPDVAQKERAELAAFAKANGYSDEELAMVSDARVLALLRKAMLYDRVQSQKPKVEKKLEEVRTVRPGTGNVGKKPPTAAQRAEQRFRKSGSVDDLAELFLQQDRS